MCGGQHGCDREGLDFFHFLSEEDETLRSRRGKKEVMDTEERKTG